MSCRTGDLEAQVSHYSSENFLDAFSSASVGGGGGVASTMGGGNWLLHDEIMLTVGYTSQFLDFVKSVGAGVEGTKAGAGLFSLAHNVVKRLQHLSSSFFTVIFQEGIKCFQKEEPSGILSYLF